MGKLNLILSPNPLFISNFLNSPRAGGKVNDYKIREASLTNDCQELSQDSGGGGSPRCAITVELQKAYDTVQWQFLFDVLRAMHFPELVIGWIKECVCTAHFSISMNGFLEGYFAGKW